MRWLSALGLTLLFWLSGPVELALAHDGNPHGPQDLWSAWSWDPTILLGLAVSGWLYAAGVRSLWRQAGPGHGVSRGQVGAFAGGLLAVFVALVSPVDALGEVLFSGHMVQHMLLIFLAAPLLAFGASPVALAWSVPGRWRVGLSRWWHRQKTAQAAVKVILHPYLIWILHVVALWAWHIPGLYALALESDFFHAGEHLSFLGTACLFWWSVFYAMRREAGLGFAILYIFTMALQGGLLGALITFSPEVWYTAHLQTVVDWNLTALEDQQLAGVIMWVPAGIVYVGVALVLLGKWISQLEQKDGQAHLDRKQQPLP